MYESQSCQCAHQNGSSYSSSHKHSSNDGYRRHEYGKYSYSSNQPQSRVETSGNSYRNTDMRYSSKGGKPFDDSGYTNGTYANHNDFEDESRSQENSFSPKNERAFDTNSYQMSGYDSEHQNENTYSNNKATRSEVGRLQNGHHMHNNSNSNSFLHSDNGPDLTSTPEPTEAIVEQERLNADGTTSIIRRTVTATTSKLYYENEVPKIEVHISPATETIVPSPNAPRSEPVNSPKGYVSSTKQQYGHNEKYRDYGQNHYEERNQHNNDDNVLSNKRNRFYDREHPNGYQDVSHFSNSNQRNVSRTTHSSRNLENKSSHTSYTKETNYNSDSSNNYHDNRSGMKSSPDRNMNQGNQINNSSGSKQRNRTAKQGNQVNDQTDHSFHHLRETTTKHGHQMNHSSRDREREATTKYSRDYQRGADPNEKDLITQPQGNQRGSNSNQVNQPKHPSREQQRGNEIHEGNQTHSSQDHRRESNTTERNRITHTSRDSQRANRTNQGKQTNSTSRDSQRGNNNNQGKQANSTSRDGQRGNNNNQGKQINSTSRDRQRGNNNNQGNQGNSTSQNSQRGNNDNQGKQINSTSRDSQRGKNNNQGKQINSTSRESQRDNRNNQGKQINSTSRDSQRGNSNNQGKQINSTSRGIQRGKSNNQGKQINPSSIGSGKEATANRRNQSETHRNEKKHGNDQVDKSLRTSSGSNRTRQRDGSERSDPNDLHGSNDAQSNGEREAAVEKNGENMNGELQLDQLVELLKSNDRILMSNAAGYISHLVFKDEEAKRKVREMDIIPLLVRLLDNEDEDCNRNAAGALKNLSYGQFTDDNKLAIFDCGGVAACGRLLHQTESVEVKENVTGILYNISSVKEIKHEVLKETLEPIANLIIIPLSGWEKEFSMMGRKPGAILWSVLLRNSIGVLRNVSSLGRDARVTIRSVEGLIDALVWILRGGIADEDRNQINNKIMENIMCVLRNLSYKVDMEINREIYLDAIKKSTRDGALDIPVESPTETDLLNPAEAESSGEVGTLEGIATGCMGMKKKPPRKQKSNLSRERSHVRSYRDQPPPEEWKYLIPVQEDNPVALGVELLWQPDLITLYIYIITNSTNPITLEAAAGAIHNLCGCKWNWAGLHRIHIRLQKGIPPMHDLLSVDQEYVVRAVAYALRNMAIDNTNKWSIGKYAHKTLLQILPKVNAKESNTKPCGHTICTILSVLQVLVYLNFTNAKYVKDAGGIPKLVALTREPPEEVKDEVPLRIYSPRVVIEANRVLLYMWEFKECRDVIQRENWSYDNAEEMERVFVSETMNIENRADSYANMGCDEAPAVYGRDLRRYVEVEEPSAENRNVSNDNDVDGEIIEMEGLSEYVSPDEDAGDEEPLVGKRPMARRNKKNSANNPSERSSEKSKLNKINGTGRENLINEEIDVSEV